MVSRFQQLHDFIVWPTLQKLGERYNSEAARRLLLGTIAHESKGDFIDQILSSADRVLGPAIGLYQIESATHDDMFDNFLEYRTALMLDVEAFRAEVPSPHEQLATNLAYATAIARMLYFRQPQALPNPDDDDGLASYWKRWYNTEKGAGTTAAFLYSYVKEVKHLNFTQPPNQGD